MPIFVINNLLERNAPQGIIYKKIIMKQGKNQILVLGEGKLKANSEQGIQLLVLFIYRELFTICICAKRTPQPVMVHCHFIVFYVIGYNPHHHIHYVIVDDQTFFLQQSYLVINFYIYSNLFDTKQCSILTHFQCNFSRI